MLARSTAARKSCVSCRRTRFTAPGRGYLPICLENSAPNNLPILVRGPRKVNLKNRIGGVRFATRLGARRYNMQAMAPHGNLQSKKETEFPSRSMGYRNPGGRHDHPGYLSSQLPDIACTGSLSCTTYWPQSSNLVARTVESTPSRTSKRLSKKHAGLLSQAKYRPPLTSRT